MKIERVTNKTFVLTATIGSILIMVMVLVNTIWAARQTYTATDNAVSAVSSFYLEAMADRRAKTITNLISNNFTQMEKALTIFSDEGIEDQEHLRSVIGKIKSLLSLNRLALVDEDNIVYTQYTTYTGGSRHDFLSDEKLKDRIISTVFLYGSSTQLCLVIPADGLTMLGRTFKACFVQIDIGEIVKLLAFEDQGRTDFAIYSKDGENLSDTELGSIISGSNILDATKKVLFDDKWQELKSNFETEKAGHLTFKQEKAEETLYYVPIPGTGWQMVVLIRGNIINEQIRGISDQNLSFSIRQIVFTVVAMIIFAAILLLMLRRISAVQLEAEKENSRNFMSMANTDSLTGIRNKHAFSAYEESLDESIRNKAIQNVAVAVCDINGLKHVNDTLGHAAGDKLIKDASVMLCEYFKHGAVFRIGGDEFVIILQGKGFDTKDEVIKEFNKKVESNISTGGVVISLGYSTLTEGDEQLKDIFKRADQMMYERKKELKGMGAITRET
ncbi:MAG: diguanylate cyclase [Lachnospiraceae bacterium]|nr:diguanylate cyclase [Lachnospiraceae bacterium]